jgi:putative lipase involved disintegration of autophagic bodies
MINDLKEFKNATKRIQKILQTFEIKTPEAFRLSNSASLNFMARILGYENYNTIKVVLENNISKEQEMKLIKMSENSYMNMAQLSGFRIAINTKWNGDPIYNITFDEGEQSYSLYEFKKIENAQNVLNKIVEFAINDTEKLLDLDKIISKINNTDNRANQLNPNNEK